MRKTPVVWVIKEQAMRGGESSVVMNYLPAEQYGEIRFITRSDIPLHASSSTREVWNDDVRKFVAEYDERLDFIVATGQATAICAIGYLLGLSGKVPRFLVWRREEDAYRILDGITNPRQTEVSHG